MASSCASCECGARWCGLLCGSRLPLFHPAAPLSILAVGPSSWLFHPRPHTPCPRKERDELVVEGRALAPMPVPRMSACVQLSGCPPPGRPCDMPPERASGVSSSRFTRRSAFARAGSFIFLAACSFPVPGSTHTWLFQSVGLGFERATSLNILRISARSTDPLSSASNFAKIALASLLDDKNRNNIARKNQNPSCNNTPPPI